MFGKSKKFQVFFLLAVIISFLAAVFAVRKIWPERTDILIEKMNPSASEEKNAEAEKEKIFLKEPEISGWIAWWLEKDGRKVVEKHSDKLASVSPGWLKLGKSGKLSEVGENGKKDFSRKCRESSSSIKVYPMLITDMDEKELADFVKDEKALKAFLEELIEKLKEYEVDGLDLDFENVSSRYAEEFSFLVETLSKELKKNDFYFAVTIQPQTGKPQDWEGFKGQNIQLIAGLADEVRIMIYDRHGSFSEPGPITPTDWYLEVLEYNLKIIPREKIVAALPTYGYIWLENGDFKSFQYQDFLSYAEGKKYEISRDSSSFELKYANKNSTGFLSDSKAVIEKMRLARQIGINRFSIWNLAGTDEEIFRARL